MMMPPPNVPQGLLQSPGLMSDTIAAMRWENDPLVRELKTSLGGYQYVLDAKNQVVLARPNDAHPLVNDIGLERFISTIRGVVNPVVALSNLDEQDGDVLVFQILDRLIMSIVLNQERFAIDDGDLELIMSVLSPIVYSQVMRAVGGHEASNYRTQTVEQNVSQTMHNNNGTGGGSSFNPFSWGRK